MGGALTWVERETVPLPDIREREGEERERLRYARDKSVGLKYTRWMFLVHAAAAAAAEDTSLRVFTLRDHPILIS